MTSVGQSERCQGSHLPPREVTKRRVVGVYTVPDRGTCRLCGGDYTLQRTGRYGDRCIVRAHDVRAEAQRITSLVSSLGPTADADQESLRRSPSRGL